ncbi:MAG: DUF3173 family protein [Sporolactobacillus sp.]
MKKRELMALGLSDYQATEAVRKIKYRLKQELPLYANKRIAFVPTSEVAHYLFGVSREEPLPDNPVQAFKQRLITLSELTTQIGSPQEARMIIRTAQRHMVEQGCDFYQNVRHWIVPQEAVEQILFKHSKEKN